MSKKIIWVSLPSANDELRILKPHAFKDNGNGGNISLCSRISVYEDGNLPFNDLLTNYKDEVSELGKCKHCEHISNRVRS
jgi:hypothetical protein